MKAQKCFIRKNTPELREKLKSFGIHICPCALFEDWDWLSISECGCHGIGKSGDFGEDIRDIFLYEDTDYIDCFENEELFLAIAALRDDTDNNQWFIDPCGYWHFNPTLLDGLRKATVSELIEHFKK